ncbi:MAG: hypothetical protein M4D85_09355, partial [Actinomycetota bacterium]|nr:hypothetical protein [Actinomycetota bacterium]
MTLAVGSEHVQELVERGRQSGALSPDEVTAALLAGDLPLEALDGVLLALKSAGIEVVEPVEEAEPADREPPDSKDGAFRRGMLDGAERAAASSDPVRLYLKQIGKVALLTAADEVELSKAIEAGLFAAERLAEPG